MESLANAKGIHGTAEVISGNREDMFSSEVLLLISLKEQHRRFCIFKVTEQMCNIVCAMCGLMSDNYLAWEEHVAEVALKEDSDHESLLAVKINKNGDKVTS